MARTIRRESPATFADAAAALRACDADGSRVRFVGAGTKLGWGQPGPEPDVELSTQRLDRVLEHNAGDLTAIVEAGVRLADAQAQFAEAGQMLALDPPLGGGADATVGGALATGDSGPLRHRHGGPRDLVLGMTVVLADGTVAKSGGKVIKNVAGYDLGKLFCGSFGTLGLIASVSLRLHPRPERTATTVARTGDAETLQRAAVALASSSLESQCLDVRWEAGEGEVLARFAGLAAEEQASAAMPVLANAGAEPTLAGEDEAPWERQRAAQRADEAGAVVRVAGLPSELSRIAGAVERAGATLAGRGALGALWVRLPAIAAEDLLRAVTALRSDLHPLPCVLLDAPREVRDALDVWDAPEAPALELSRRLKARFDERAICNRGLFVGGI